jgi:hypothetical protein
MADMCFADGGFLQSRLFTNYSSGHQLLGMSVEAVSDLDLSYTPPLSSPWEPVQMAAQFWSRTGFTAPDSTSNAVLPVASVIGPVPLR